MNCTFQESDTNIFFGGFCHDVPLIYKEGTIFQQYDTSKDQSRIHEVLKEKEIYMSSENLITSTQKKHHNRIIIFSKAQIPVAENCVITTSQVGDGTNYKD